MISPRKAVLAASPLLMPIFCTWIIHHYFHEVFGDNNLTLGIYSRDIYIPLGIGAIFCLYQMIGSGVTVRLRLRAFVAFIGTLTAQILFLKNYIQLSLRFPHEILVVLLLLGCLVVLAFSFLSTIKPSEIMNYIKKRNSAAIYSLIALISLFNYPMILKVFWRQASFLTAKSVYYFYQLFGINLKFSLTPVSFNLSGSGFAIKIIMGCSGLEGIFFFVFAFSLIQLIGKKNIDKNVLLAYGVGSVFLFLLNTLRISSFYFLGIQLEKMAIDRTGKNLIEGAFHNHLGWILYLLGIIIFVRIYRKYEMQKTTIRLS